MNVAQILQDKGNEVLTVQPHRTMHEAARLLAERRVGAVVVADAAGAVLGILSERDLVRALSASGADSLNQPVSAHMTRNPITASRDDDLDTLMRAMTEGRFRHLPIVSEGHLIGIVSIGDVVKRHVDALHFERDSLREYIASA